MHFITSLRFIAVPFTLAALMLGCAVDANGESEPEEKLGQTSQAINGWMPFAWGTTKDMTGLDTNVSNQSWNCVLSGVTGDLSKGRYWEQQAVSSVAKVARAGMWSQTFHVIAHGGAYENQADDRVWANNPVWASTVCMPYPQSEEGTWRSNFNSVASPQKIASLATNRVCFLRGIVGGEHLWNSSTYARVVKITTPDATHPSTGFYVESNERSDTDGGHAYVDATCMDFPPIYAWDSGSVGAPSDSSLTVPLTSGAGVKACGLIEVRGAFNKNSWSDGVRINGPSTAGGNWSMTVSAGKVGRAICVL